MRRHTCFRICNYYIVFIWIGIIGKSPNRRAVWIAVAA